jgi:site-specific recombinase XerD
MGAEEVKAFLSYLVTQMNVAASTQNQAFSALLFSYKEVLKQRLPWIEDIVRAKRPAKVPVVFSQAEARAVLSKMTGTARLMAHLLYGSGLRVMECVRLRNHGGEAVGVVVAEPSGRADGATGLNSRTSF